jgi:ankyrin repeat protein
VDVALFGSNQDLEKLDPNQSTPGGTTVLMLAASDISRVKLLLGRGARVNLRSKTGFSAFLVACSYGDNAGVLRLLLDAGTQIDPPAGVKVLFKRSPLMQAVVTGDLDEVKLIVGRHTPVARKELVFGGMPLNPLQMAVFFNDLQTVQYLARNGGLVDEVYGDGVSPLELAALFDYPDMITLLAQLGADPNHVDKAGMTPLIWASTIEFGSPATAQALLKAGARPDIAGKGGATALSQATKHRIESIRSLLLPRTVQ